MGISFRNGNAEVSRDHTIAVCLGFADSHRLDAKKFSAQIFSPDLSAQDWVLGPALCRPPPAAFRCRHDPRPPVSMSLVLPPPGLWA